MFFDHYPYTNFHNINLDWVLQAVKSWGQTVEANDRAFQDLKEANEDFKEYVTNYLQNLDVSDEINTKLDQMLASGVLTPYFAPYVQGYVNSWLNSHVTPTSPALDNTLSLSGAAARADAVGHRLKDLAYIDALSTPEVVAALNRSQVLPGYRVQGITYDYDGHYYVCGGSVDEDGTGVIVKMTKPDFTDAEIFVIPLLGHANDITYYDGYLYVCTVGGGDAPQWGIYKINVNDFTDKTLISNAPENTIGISYRQGDFWILAPYRIYRTTDFTSYEVVVANTNDLLTAYGIPTSGRISQTIFRAAGYLIGWVCSFVFDERHYGAITFFSSTGEPVAFKMFPAYHSEIQGAVYADMSIYLLADGNMVNVFRMDPRHLSYVQLKAGDDLNSFTGRGTLYSTGSNVSSELVNSPSAGEGFTVQVDRLGVYNTIQTARTNSGREMYRIKSFNTDTWGEWIEPAAEVTQIKEDLSDTSDYIYNSFGTEKIDFIENFYIKNNSDNIASAVASPTDSASWEYAIIPCAFGDVFELNCDSGSNPKAYCFTDSDYNVLRISKVTRFSGTVIAPTNSAFLVVNKSKANTGKSYIGKNRIDENTDELAFFNKNIISCGLDNMVWSWWIYPQVISFKRIRDKLYWGYTTNDGYKGIAEYDFDTQFVKKNNIARAKVDDHNGLAIYVYEDGTILTAYSTGHGEDNCMRVRVSESAENIEHFKDEVVLPSPGNTAYCQLNYYDGKLYMFYRMGTTNWAYRYSEDKGETWSSETVLISSGIQYYCKFVPTTTDGILRVVMYSNPDLGGNTDANIREAFLHLDTGVLYNSDNATELGTSSVSKDSVTVIIPVESGFTKQRLLDVAITEIARPLILYAPFTTGADNVYKIFDTNESKEVVVGGTPLVGSYLLGMSWIGVNRIAVSHGSGSNGGQDIIDLYSYVNGEVTLEENIATERRGNIPIRNARPIADINGKAFLWQRGYYGASYTDFNMDAKIHVI